MARGRSTFSKRQKEQARQQKQRDKAERRNQRKQEKPVISHEDELLQLREHAEAQAAMFRISPAQSGFPDPTPDGDDTPDQSTSEGNAETPER
jgi:hypothetical protein